jgi:uncharacterized protein YukE
MENENGTTSSFIDQEVKPIPSYDGNGWSKYQILVLNQLNDHSRAIKQLWENDTNNRIKDSLSSKEHIDFKECQKELKKTIQELNEVLRDLAERIDAIEEKERIKSGIDSGIKVYWGFLGAAAAFILNFLFTKIDKVIEFFQHINSGQ